MSEQQSDQAAPGWYPDPVDATRMRWWSGTAWAEASTPAAGAPADTTAVAAAGAPAGIATAVAAGAAPAGTAAVGSERRWGTVWVWLLAFSPWLTTVTGYLVLTAGGPDDTNPWDQVLLGAVPFALVVLVAALDVRQLRQWHDPVAHWAWAVLGGPIYIIARTVFLRRHGRFGSAPLWVALANMVAALIPFLPLAGLYFWGLVMGIYSTFPHP